MRISWNWLKELLPASVSVDQAAELLTDIGLEVESVEVWRSVKGGLEGLVTGEVLAVSPHPDADRLQVTQVSIGEEAPLQIVCGAPNVAKGQKVVVATVGTTIHPVSGEAFTIRKAKIRGVSSEGMLCAEDEIGLGDGHDGILVLPAATQVGIALTEIIPVLEDHLLEIGLTANHADAFSHYGVARELSAALAVRSMGTIHPDFPENSPLPDGKPAIVVEVQNHSACPRYSGIVIRNIQVGPSPEHIQERLKAIGMRAVNNVVDVTNLVLHELGQPLHAFDLDKIGGQRIVVRNVADGTTFHGLDDKEYTLSAQDLMICDAEGAMCIGGVFGGKDSGVSASTTSIFLESAFFSGAGIRRSESRLGLKTDASSRFAKGTDPEMTVAALGRALFLLQQTSEAEPVGGLVDIYPEKISPFKVELRKARLRNIAGTDIPDETVELILRHLDIQIVSSDEQGWQTEVPVRKNDVTREIDLIEEVMRFYGYDHIPVPKAVRTPFSLSPKPDLERIRLQACRFLAAQGFYEVFTNSISRSKYVDRWMPAHQDQVVRLLNSLNAELDSMRPTTLFSHLEAAQYNVNRKQQDLRFFEFGKVFNRSGDSYTEVSTLSLLISGRREPENWNTSKEITTIFDMKACVQLLSNQWHISAEETAFEDHPLLEHAIALHKGQEVVGVYGEVKPAIRDAFDIRYPVYFAEIFWIKWLDGRSEDLTMHTLPKYPEVRRDLALILEPEVSFDKVRSVTRQTAGDLLQNVVLFDVYEGEKLQGKKSYAIGLTFRDDTKTLTDKEVEASVNRVIKALEKETGATIRST